MKKLVRVLSSVFVTLGIFVGTTIAAPVAFAEPAQAYTTSSCYYTSIWAGGGSYTYVPVYSCYYDYNWWEETFLGKRDGRYYVQVPVRA